MLNDSPPEDQPVHPLERKPPEAEPAPRRRHPLEQPPPPPQQNQAPRQQGVLHIPSVTPVVTYSLVAAIVVIFAAGFLVPDLGRTLYDWGSNVPREVLVWGEYHRLLASMFLHGSAAHLLFNASALYLLGTGVERIMGHLRFALIYFLGGLAGSVMSAILGSAGNVPSVGASAAIFAVLGAEYVFLHEHRKLLGTTGQARRRALLVLGLVNLAFGVATTLGDGPLRIDNWAHLGGLIGGVALAWFIAPLFVLRRHPDYPNSNHLLAVDINPLNRKYWAVSIYCAVILVVMLSAVIIVR